MELSTRVFSSRAESQRRIPCWVIPKMYDSSSSKLPNLTLYSLPVTLDSSLIHNNSWCAEISIYVIVKVDCMSMVSFDSNISTLKIWISTLVKIHFILVFVSHWPWKLDNICTVNMFFFILWSRVTFYLFHINHLWQGDWANLFSKKRFSLLENRCLTFSFWIFILTMSPCPCIFTSETRRNNIQCNM